MYRIWTEDIFADVIGRKLDELFDNYAVYNGVAAYKGKHENNLLIELFGEDVTQAKVLHFCDWLCKHNRQESVAWLWSEEPNLYYGDRDRSAPLDTVPVNVAQRIPLPSEQFGVPVGNKFYPRETVNERIGVYERQFEAKQMPAPAPFVAFVGPETEKQRELREATERYERPLGLSVNRYNPHPHPAAEHYRSLEETKVMEMRPIERAIQEAIGGSLKPNQSN